MNDSDNSRPDRQSVGRNISNVTLAVAIFLCVLSVSTYLCSRGIIARAVTRGSARALVDLQNKEAGVFVRGGPASDSPLSVIYGQGSVFRRFDELSGLRFRPTSKMDVERMAYNQSVAEYIQQNGVPEWSISSTVSNLTLERKFNQLGEGERVVVPYKKHGLSVSVDPKRLNTLLVATTKSLSSVDAQPDDLVAVAFENSIHFLKIGNSISAFTAEGDLIATYHR